MKRELKALLKDQAERDRVEKRQRELQWQAILQAAADATDCSFCGRTNTPCVCYELFAVAMQVGQDHEVKQFFKEIWLELC